MIAEAHVEQHRAELQRIAECAHLKRVERGLHACTPHYYTVRQRIGWLLVERGLRLVG
jgi:hypothetical protein